VRSPHVAYRVSTSSRVASRHQAGGGDSCDEDAEGAGGSLDGRGRTSELEKGQAAPAGAQLGQAWRAPRDSSTRSIGVVIRPRWWREPRGEVVPTSAISREGKEKQESPGTTRARHLPRTRPVHGPWSDDQAKSPAAHQETISSPAVALANRTLAALTGSGARLVQAVGRGDPEAAGSSDIAEQDRTILRENTCVLFGPSCTPGGGGIPRALLATRRMMGGGCRKGPRPAGGRTSGQAGRARRRGTVARSSSVQLVTGPGIA